MCITALMESNSKSIKDFGFSTTEELNELYIHLLSRIEYNNDAYGTNKFAHFKILLKLRGFIDITKYNKTDFDIKNHKKIAKDIKQERSDNFDPSTEHNKRINKYLNLSECDIIKYKELFLESAKLHEHFRVCDFFLKTREHNLKKLQDAKDFNIKTLRSSKAKMYFLHKMYELVNKKHTDYTERPMVATTATEEQSKSINKAYELIFNSKLKKPYDLRTHYDCDRIINKIYTKLFRGILEKQRGCTWNATEYEKKRKGEKWILKKDEIERHANIYKFRQNDTPVLEFLPEDEPARETPTEKKKIVIETTQDDIDNFFNV